MDEAVKVFLEQGGIAAAVAIIEAGAIIFLYKEIKGKDAIITNQQKELLSKVEANSKENKDLAQQVINTVGTLNELFSNSGKRRS